MGQVIRFPRDENMETAQMVLMGDPHDFTDAECEAAAHYVMDHSRDWVWITRANSVLHAIHAARRAETAKRVTSNIYPRQMDNPSFVFWGLMVIALMGFFIAWSVPL